MATDPIYGAELLEEGTAQAELVINELLGRLIAGSVRVLSNGDTTPPVSPANFDAYIVGAAATGDWSGQDGLIAFYVDGWKFITPTEGLRVRVTDDNYGIEYDGTNWVASGLGFQTLVDAATIAWDTALGASAKVTLTDNRTVGLPTHLADGMVLTLHVIQDGTGSRTLTWNAAFKWPGAGTAPTLSTGAGALDVFQFLVRGGALYGMVIGLDFA